MIQIDKADKLYKYLVGLGVENLEEQYNELASAGRYLPKDIQTYFYADFQPSLTNDIESADLEKVTDYYSDLKKVKTINQTELNATLKRYKQKPTKEDKETILKAKLKELLYLAINYKSAHKDVDLQDVVQVANMGLLKALEKYNPKSKIAFKDYIIYWVREEINKEFKNAKY